MKQKYLKEYYDKETGGISIVTIQNKYGVFSGMAICHPDDKDNISQWAGHRYAEIRAQAKFAKYRYKQEKIKLKTMKDLLQDVTTVILDPDPKVVRRIKLKIRNYTQSTEDWYNIYTFSEKLIKKLDKERQEILEKYSTQDKEK